MSNADNSGFGKFVPGFEFMQNLAKQAAGGLAQGVQQSVPQMPSLSSWVAPTFNVEDLEKRIEELKAVHFWLDQNSRALAATIQALEVQKMTLSTLQGMNLSLGDVASAMKIKTADVLSGMTGMAGKAFDTPPAPAPTAPTQFAGLEIPPRRAPTVAPAPAPEPEPEAPAPTPSSAPAASTPAAGAVIDPMQWWGALSQQFQTIATNAMADASRQTALDAGKNMATALTREAVKTATDMTAGMARGLTGKGGAKAARSAAWPMPAAGKVAKPGATKPSAGAVAKAVKATAGKAVKAVTQTAAKNVKASAKAVSKPKAASASAKPTARRAAASKPAGRAR